MLKGDSTVSEAVIRYAIEVRLTYLRVTNKGVGLLLNFNTAVMRNGIRRILLDRPTG